ncbi:uncharacterized protein PITG_15528 [Phytophthora infestans T30-4]|uniref:Uncharacterized protein n=1 Tax=Phytophthora infestans (strain T30-4) TaxID=403677 RepID=D0NT88_PHYIT|nr:uncharacterized protein PITG_15528 [Phytophthora infestans T30-4]EEY64756.1 hypothetical protein PITG_15528 [Phytophthora infestans T30-4]|eukprot:XP_002897683.1 hypothetical protein PITG_15528 [Phytophthora infestans T30-4]
MNTAKAKSGQVTAFNRFMDDWSVLVQMRSQDVQLSHSAADLDFPNRSHENETEQAMMMRLKLRKKL